MKVSFNNLKELHGSLSSEIRKATNRVLESGWYVLGPEVKAFEKEFAKYHEVKYAVAVANGTDAIELSLRAAGVGKGHEVITVSHTAVATVCAIERAGAKPIFVDIDEDTYTMDHECIEAAITNNTKAVLPVHLYGHPADITKISRITKKHKLLLIEDCAQAHGATVNRCKVGTFGHLSAFSFYPTKNLGAYGDGGAVITNDSKLAKKITRLRNYGQISRYEFVEWGVNSRMDELQAAILRVKLKHLDKHNKKRRKLVSLYKKYLKKIALPKEKKGFRHVYHLVVVKHKVRDELQEILSANDIDTLIHYPLPVHLQPAYKHLGYTFGSLPVTEKVSSEIISLPLHFGLKEKEIAYVSKIINNAKI